MRVGLRGQVARMKRREMHTKLVGKSDEKIVLGELGIEERIILKCMLMKCEVRVTLPNSQIIRPYI